MTNGSCRPAVRVLTMAETPADRSAGDPSWRSPIVATPGPTDDAAIVAAVLDGDRDAYRILVDRESRSVVRACLRVLGDLPEAEDVAQEAFVTAYRSLASWRADGPFGAWIARIAVRLAIRQLGRRRAVTWVRPEPGRSEPADQDFEDRVPALQAGAASDPERAALQGERDRTIQAAVAALADPYRETVALRFFAERSLDEIASVTGRPLGTVKTHLRRGLLQLRDRLEPGTVS
ncbi:MAG TPA: sigma-70 family RNA polymerase sigma factor [Candidatus Limnocylindrales bacterium]